MAVLVKHTNGFPENDKLMDFSNFQAYFSGIGPSKLNKDEFTLTGSMLSKGTLFGKGVSFKVTEPIDITEAKLGSGPNGYIFFKVETGTDTGLSVSLEGSSNLPEDTIDCLDNYPNELPEDVKINNVVHIPVFKYLNNSIDNDFITHNLKIPQSLNYDNANETLTLFMSDGSELSTIISSNGDSGSVATFNNLNMAISDTDWGFIAPTGETITGNFETFFSFLIQNLDITKPTMFLDSINKEEYEFVHAMISYRLGNYIQPNPNVNSSPLGDTYQIKMELTPTPSGDVTGTIAISGGHDFTIREFTLLKREKLPEDWEQTPSGIDKFYYTIEKNKSQQYIGWAGSSYPGNLDISLVPFFAAVGDNGWYGDEVSNNPSISNEGKVRVGMASFKEITLIFSDYDEGKGPNDFDWFQHTLKVGPLSYTKDKKQTTYPAFMNNMVHVPTGTNLNTGDGVNQTWIFKLNNAWNIKKAGNLKDKHDSVIRSIVCEDFFPEGFAHNITDLMPKTLTVEEEDSLNTEQKSLLNGNAPAEVLDVYRIHQLNGDALTATVLSNYVNLDKKDYLVDEIIEPELKNDTSNVIAKADKLIREMREERYKGE